MQQSTAPILWLSLIISALIALSSSVGINSPEIYEANAFQWQVEIVWQDYVNIVLVIPLLIGSAMSAYHGSDRSEIIWVGILVYLAYNYAIYCFAVHFNEMFFFYCLILGLVFYSLVWELYRRAKMPITFAARPGNTHFFMATYLIVLGSSFYIGWLTDIIPSILRNTVPANVKEFDLLTNPVHVLDLAIILPAFIIIGIMVYSSKGPWLPLAGAMLVFAMIMSLTISGLQIAMFFGGLKWNSGLAAIMLALAATDFILIVKTMPGATKENRKSLRALKIN